MSGSARTVSIRVSAEEVDSARSRLEALGDVGDRALRRVETAAQAAANAFAGLARPADAEALRRRGADIAAYGVELDRLRGKFDPLFASQQRHKALLAEIGQAERAGAIDAATATAARDRTVRGYLESTAAMRGMAPAAQSAAGAQATLARTGENASYQQKQLAFQLNDVFQTLALGAPPMQVFLQQGPQIVQIYGGVGNTLRTFTAFVGGPFVLAFAAGALAVGAMAARRWAWQPRHARCRWRCAASAATPRSRPPTCKATSGRWNTRAWPAPTQAASSPILPARPASRPQTSAAPRSLRPIWLRPPAPMPRRRGSNSATSSHRPPTASASSTARSIS